MGLTPEFAHEIVNHLESYVNGPRSHERDGELLEFTQRTLGGTYISVDPFHLFRYLDEQCFRFNKRRLTDAERFVIVLGQTIGKRITYDEPTGKADTPIVQA